MNSMIQSFIMTIGPMKAMLLANQFRHLGNIKDMFTQIWDTQESHICFKPSPIEAKSEERSNECREEGNKFYKSGWYDMALICYNTSIRIAPHPDFKCSFLSKTTDGACDDSHLKIPSDNKCFPNLCEENLKQYKTLGMAYANRSAVYMVMKEYDKCILDIEMALNYGYPTEFKKKLEERRERCLEMKAKSKVKAVEHDVFSNNEKKKPNLPDTNSKVPTFSNAVEVSYSSDKGRHVIATRDILPGELIAVEKSYCSIINTDPDKEPHCPVCLMFCQRQIPCPTCSMVSFCSDHCRAKGMEEHRKECNAMSILYAHDLEDDPIAYMAAKILTCTTYEDLKALVPVLKREEEESPFKKLGFNKKGKFISSNYRTVYHMVNTRNQDRFEKAVGHCLKAVFITKVLEKTGDFFVSKDGRPFKPSREDLIFTGETLLRHMIYYTTLIAIADIKVSSRQEKTDKKVVGTGIYPSLNLMRHSCNAPTLFYNIGHAKIVRTILPIKKGQEVTLAFTDRYQTTPYFVRQLQMEMAGIKCSCEACVGNWPCVAELPPEIRFKCMSCGGIVVRVMNDIRCKECNVSYKKNGRGKDAMGKKWHSVIEEIVEGSQKIQALKHNLKIGKKPTRSDYEFLCRQASLVGEHVHQPSPVHAILRDMLLTLFYVGF